MDDHFIRMSQQIGELNGTVKEMSFNMREFIEATAERHAAHEKCCSENKVDIAKINSRHSTYWKIIGSLGGLGGLGAFLSKIGKIGGG